MCPPAVLAIVAALVLAACSHPSRLPPVPEGRAAAAIVPGILNARFSPLDDPAPIVREGLASVERECGCPITELPETMPPAHFLAVSGGGEDGAFGAGLLVGWTEHGDRPEFKLVTGISTGALTAPFAFLGPDYDDALRAIYTTTGPDDVFRERDFTAAMFDDAMGDTAPLYETVSRYADEALLEAIAAEYGRGRLLIVGTTDLDARRAVLWNMTAIAASDAPNRLDLFRRILLASAAIPAPSRQS